MYVCSCVALLRYSVPSVNPSPLLQVCHWPRWARYRHQWRNHWRYSCTWRRTHYHGLCSPSGVHRRPRHQPEPVCLLPLCCSWGGSEWLQQSLNCLPRSDSPCVASTSVPPSARPVHRWAWHSMHITAWNRIRVHSVCVLDVVTSTLLRLKFCAVLSAQTSCMDVHALHGTSWGGLCSLQFYLQLNQSSSPQ